MLKPHQLDDQNFIDIVTRSRRLIQKYAADWTNENASDPGITILEMLAWLKDNMQYYMDQSHLISEKAYLSLLGIKPLAGRPAEMIATVKFTDSAQDDYMSGRIRQTQILPKGFPVWADNTRFELVGSTQVQVSNILSVYSADKYMEGSIADLIGAFENDAAAFPFGTSPQAGKCLYIGFDDIRAGLVSFFIDVEDDPNGFRNPYDYSKIAFAKGVWELASSRDEKSGRMNWTPLKTVLDETHGFMNDGIVTLQIDTQTYLKKTQLIKGEKNLVWLRYRLEEAHYDRPPVIENIIMNAVKLRQEHTVIGCHKLIKHMTQNRLEVLIEDYVPEGAEIILELMSESGYKTIDRSNYDIVHHDNGTLSLHLNDHHSSVDIAQLRLITGDPVYEGVKTYDVKGLPYESIDTVLSNLLYETVRVEVSEDYASDKWVPWETVHHLWGSMSSSRHVQLSSDDGVLSFGNNEQGMLPDSKAQGLRIIGAKLSNKDKGNGAYSQIQIDEVMGTVYAFKPISKAIGGRKLESDEAAFIRFNKAVASHTRMMSSQHIEHIIKTTPGLAIRDVSVIAGQSPAESGRIIVLPKSENKNPKLPKIYETFLKKRISDTRLITEHWKVSGPDYISMKVKLEIIKDPAVFVQSEKIQALVAEFIEPDTGKLFGRRFSAGMLKRKIESVSGVLRVSRLSLRTLQGSYKRADGDVQLPDSAIGYLSNVDLQILDDQGW